MPTTIFEASVKMELITCWECGVSFAVPFNWLDPRCTADDDDADRDVYCPAGHVNHYWKSGKEDTEKLKAENEQLRRELVQEKHNAEQAEGRRADGRPITEPVLSSDPPDDERLHCPKCEKSYIESPRLRQHLERVHKLSEIDAAEAVKAIRERRAA